MYIDIISLIICIVLIVIVLRKQADKKEKFVPICLFCIQIMTCIGSFISNMPRPQISDLSIQSFLFFAGYNLLTILGIGFMKLKK